MKPYELSLTETAASIRRGALGAEELAHSLIERHERLEPSIQATALFDPDRLLAAARQIDDRHVAQKALGPLAGVPIGVKDIYDCADVPTAAGIRSGKKWIPKKTAAALTRLFEADALLYGKTTTTERAFLDPCQTRNPWNLAHTPGGSSSGSAAGTAARLFPVAIGSQTAGSVIRPASYCGVIGMTLTHGRVSLERGVVPLAPRFDTAGFFVRSVEDAELLLAVWCGADGSGPSLREIPQGGFDRPVFLGLARRGFIDRTEEEAAQQLIHTTKLLSKHHAIIHVINIPESYDRFNRFHRQLFAFEASQIHSAEYRQEPASFAPKIAALIKEGFEVSKTDYEEGVKALEQFRHDMLERISEVDAFILPAATGPAPRGLDSTGDPLCNAPWTAIGFPAVTIPTGFAHSGMPLGMQLVGSPMREAHLVRAARFCEQVLGIGCPSPTAIKDL